MASRPRRVTRVITRLNIGGPSIQAIGLTRDLRAAGFETCLIHGATAASEGDMRALLPIGDNASLHVEELVRPISPLRDLRALWRIYRSMREWQPEIVHTHMAKAGALGRLAALFYNRTRGRKRPARLVHTYHGHVFEGYFGSPSTKVFLAVERFLARYTDALVAISPQVRQDVIHTYGVARDEEQVHLVPLGFDLGRFAALADEDRRRARAALEIPNGAIVISTVGRLTAIKQHGLFLDMAAILAAQSPDYLFVIAGDGELRAELEARAAELGLAARLRFLGWRGDLDTVYGATDVFVLTSRNEGTPVALIEAMASGVAAVSTDVGGVRDVITSQAVGTLVPFGQPEQLAAAVARFAASAPLRREVGEAARAAVRDRFDVRRLLRDIDTLYQRLLGQVPASAAHADPIRATPSSRR
jgi:glycosyltransferase involved in cell wall biosynthesis